MTGTHVADRMRRHIARLGWCASEVQAPHGLEFRVDNGASLYAALCWCGPVTEERADRGWRAMRSTVVREWWRTVGLPRLLERGAIVIAPREYAAYLRHSHFVHAPRFTPPVRRIGWLDGRAVYVSTVQQAQEAQEAA